MIAFAANAFSDKTAANSASLLKNNDNNSNIHYDIIETG